ncbi:MAG: alpha/beta fold hydrolase [Thermoplasmatota archaeon]|nr:alpha/beta hydrolase [Halobacteriales archaeon]
MPLPPKPVDLAHEEHGPKTGPTVTLIHGFPFDRRMWGPTARVVAEAGYRVVLPDLRGHGKSPPGDGPATMEAMARDVAALLERIGARSGVVVGFSMGGYVALQMPLREREQVRALALVDTRAEADSPEAKAGRAKTIQAVREKGMQALVDGMMPKLLHADTPASKPQVKEMTERMMLENKPEGAVAALEGMRDRPDMRGKLASMHLPCLVVVGEDDQITPPDSASRMAQAFRGSDFELIPKAGHLSPLENPGKFHKVLLDWLLRVAPIR